MKMASYTRTHNNTRLLARLVQQEASPPPPQRPYSEPGHKQSFLSLSHPTFSFVLGLRNKKGTIPCPLPPLPSSFPGRQPSGGAPLRCKAPSLGYPHLPQTPPLKKRTSHPVLAPSVLLDKIYADHKKRERKKGGRRAKTPTPGSQVQIPRP